MKNVVLDVNVVLDLWLNRGGRAHQEAIEEVFQPHQNRPSEVLDFGCQFTCSGILLRIGT